MPRRLIPVLAFVVLAALSLGGCAVSGGSGASYGSSYPPYGSSYAPYDEGSNPFCGALGDCQVENPPRLGPHDGAMGGGGS
jgi:hypothetical protein